MKYALAPRPQVLRAQEALEQDLAHLRVEGFVSFEQEELEDAHLDARIESWKREKIEYEMDQCYWDALGIHEDPYAWEGHYDYEDDLAEIEAQRKEYDHAWAVVHLARDIVRTQRFPTSSVR